jgi:hypothetical protein
MAVNSGVRSDSSKERRVKLPERKSSASQRNHLHRPHGISDAFARRNSAGPSGLESLWLKLRSGRMGAEVFGY